MRILPSQGMKFVHARLNGLSKRGSHGLCFGIDADLGRCGYARQTRRFKVQLDGAKRNGADWFEQLHRQDHVAVEGRFVRIKV